eukprot:9274562-Alexandrium_andersonii.AAC.1
MKVKTRNQAGVAAKSPLVLNLGGVYNFSAAPKAESNSPSTKRYRGMLDAQIAGQRALQLAQDPDA